MKQIEIRDERELQILIEAVLHEIANTASLKAQCEEIGCGVLSIQDRLYRLKILLATLTDGEEK